MPKCNNEIKNSFFIDIAVQERTLGDGMDNLLMTSAEISTRININGNSANVILQSAKPVEPKSPIVTLIPKYVPKQRKPNHFLRKQKEPKFIPYEPYKCAIQPIVPKKQRVLQEVSKSKYSRNNVDINHLVEQMSELRSSEVNKAKIDAIQSDDGLISRKQWEEEKTALVTDIKNLRETNAHLENQLKFQAQVSSSFCLTHFMCIWIRKRNWQMFKIGLVNLESEKDANHQCDLEKKNFKFDVYLRKF